MIGRSGHTATLLPSGNVLVVGDNSVLSLASPELYDTVAGTFSVTGCLATKRIFHAETLLPSGKVLLTGGADGCNYLASAELYDPE